MPERNTPQKTLESWKQIAALPGPQRTHRAALGSTGRDCRSTGASTKSRTPSSHTGMRSIAWSRLRTKCPGTRVDVTEKADESLRSVEPIGNAYLAEHDAITRTMHCYIAGARAGDGDLMRPAFHPSATISGYCQGVEYSGSVEHVFQWITENGPAPNINPRFARIEIIETHRRRASRGSTLVRQVGWRQCPRFRRIHAAEVGMVSGRSRISSSIGTIRNARRQRDEKRIGCNRKDGFSATSRFKFASGRDRPRPCRRRQLGR